MRVDGAQRIRIVDVHRTFARGHRLANRERQARTEDYSVNGTDPQGARRSSVLVAVPNERRRLQFLKGNLDGFPCADLPVSIDIELEARLQGGVQKVQSERRIVEIPVNAAEIKPSSLVAQRPHGTCRIS